jgi:Transposase DNA-binding
MDSSLWPEGQWAREEFGTADLGDVRRNQRLVQIAEAIARSRHGTLPQSFGEDPRRGWRQSRSVPLSCSIRPPNAKAGTGSPCRRLSMAKLTS